jgi:hypothetical protein
MIEVRSYVPDDYEAVTGLYRIPSLYGGQFDEDRDSKARLNEQITKDPNSILVAEEDGNLVGTVSILADKRFAWLMRFAVQHPDAVTVLCDKACQILKERGHSQVLVYAPEDASFKLRYESLGFTEGGQTYNVFWKPLN